MTVHDPLLTRLERSGLAGSGVVGRLLDEAGLVQHGCRVGADPHASHLNASGAPIQLCLSARSDDVEASEARLLVDPFVGLAPSRRAAHAMALAGAGRSGSAWMAALPRFGEVPAAGSLWIGWCLSRDGALLYAPWKRGAAVYLNAELFGPAPWQPILTFLDRILPPSLDRARLLAAPAQGCRSVSVALELKDEVPQRIKLYLRGPAPALARFTAALDPEGDLGLLTDIVQPKAGWPAQGITLAIGFDCRSGAPDGVKLDLCLCARCRDVAGIEPGLEQRVQARMPAAISLDGVARLALLGAGAGGKGARINAYFEPC